MEVNKIFLRKKLRSFFSLCLPEKSSFQTTVDKPQLTPEVVDELLEHFVDPVHGSPSRGRKPIGVLSLRVDDLMITGDKSFRDWFVKQSASISLLVMSMSMTSCSQDRELLGCLMRRPKRRR